MTTAEQRWKDIEDCQGIVEDYIERQVDSLSFREKVMIRDAVWRTIQIIEGQTVCLPSEQNLPSSPK